MRCCWVVAVGLLMATAFSVSEIRIPLTYAFDYNKTNKLPIELSFNHSHIYSTSPTTPNLLLYSHSIAVPVRNFAIMPASAKVEIGLKFPSDFIVALAKTYGVHYEKVELDMSNFLEVLLFDNNLMESVDVWRQKGNFSIDVTYNYGPGQVISSKPMALVDGDLVYFEEYFIREVLQKMQKQNGINYKFDASRGVIELVGQLQNLPKLVLNYHGYVFKLDINRKHLNYIPALKNTHGLTLVGYRAIRNFNKMSFLTNGEI